MVKAAGKTALRIFLIQEMLVEGVGDQNYHGHCRLCSLGANLHGSSLCKILSDLTKSILFLGNLLTNSHGSVGLKISGHLLEN